MQTWDSVKCQRTATTFQTWNYVDNLCRINRVYIAFHCFTTTLRYLGVVNKEKLQEKKPTETNEKKKKNRDQIGKPSLCFFPLLSQSGRSNLFPGPLWHLGRIWDVEGQVNDLALWLEAVIMHFIPPDRCFGRLVMPDKKLIALWIFVCVQKLKESSCLAQ